jgi:hypothetical protein
MISCFIWVSPEPTWDTQMGTTETERRALMGGALSSIEAIAPLFDPLAVRLPEASRISGFSRSELYRRAARGEIILLKCGKSTLVDVPSLRAAVAALPRASIRIVKQPA